MKSWCGSVHSWISRLIICMGSCFGCCTKTPHIISVDEQSRGLKNKPQSVKKHTVTEDFWSNSSGNMENNTLQSHRSVSSVSTSNQNFDSQTSASTASNPPDNVNHGLLLWNQTRQQWVGTRGSEKNVQSKEPRISWNATYESLLSSNKPFTQPIPLGEMVEFLVDVWEQEGLYD